MTRPKTIYLVWHEDSSDDSGYYNWYDTVEEAVRNSNPDTPVYSAKPRYLGKFEFKAVMVKKKNEKSKQKTAKKGNK